MSSILDYIRTLNRNSPPPTDMPAIGRPMAGQPPAMPNGRPLLGQGPLGTAADMERLRKPYMDYAVEQQSNGQEAMPFNDWMLQVMAPRQTPPQLPPPQGQPMNNGLLQ